MGDLIIYFGVLDFVAVQLAIVFAAGLTAWLLVRRRRKWLLALVAETLEALPHGAAITWGDGSIVMANGEASQLWGTRPFPQRLEEPLAALARETEESGRHSVQALDAPSGLRLQVRAAPLESGPIILVFEDIAARQRQETFYRNFVSNVSHELKTPLTVIQGHVTAVAEGLREGDPHQTSLRIVIQEATRLTQLVDNLLLLSRLEMPDFSLQRRSTSLEAVLEDAILQMSDLAETRDISLSLRREDRIPRIAADRARLKQVFINLLDNAIKYNREGGAVTVHLSTQGSSVVVQIHDTGEGIPAQDLPHIFEKLYRVERRQGRYIEGSGLGLSIARRIVEQHGGSISATSRVDEGSTFTVTLPGPTAPPAM